MAKTTQKLNPKNVLITGASGLIGTRLTEMLLAQGYQVSHLSRSAGNDAVKSYRWDVEKRYIHPAAPNDIDAIVHLAGAGIADKPWTAERKNEILESRTRSSELLYDSLKHTTHRVKTFVSASAIGYYGLHDHGAEFTEQSPSGHDFLADVVTQWEAAVGRISALGIRVVKLRTGVVLSEKGGALKEIANPVRYFVGAPLGSGEQYVSWIHLDDVCRMYIQALEDESMQGAYNATGPYAVTNRALTKAIASVLRKPLFLPAVPAFALKTILGEMASLVLKGSNVSSEKIRQEGFVFQFDTLEAALHDLLRRK